MARTLEKRVKNLQNGNMQNTLESNLAEQHSTFKRRVTTRRKIDPNSSLHVGYDRRAIAQFSLQETVFYSVGKFKSLRR